MSPEDQYYQDQIDFKFGREGEMLLQLCKNLDSNQHRQKLKICKVPGKRLSIWDWYDRYLNHGGNFFSPVPWWNKAAFKQKSPMMIAQEEAATSIMANQDKVLL